MNRLKAWRTFVAAGPIVLLGACGVDGTTAPSAAGPLPVPFAISGWVFDTAFRRVGNVRIEVIDGPQAGIFTISEESGLFSFGGQRFTEAITLRASKEGYVSATRRVNPIGLASYAVDFGFLAAERPSVDLVGSYVITFTADSACTALPALARSRSYSAAIVRDPLADTRYTVTLSGGTFVIRGFNRYDGFVAGVFGDFVRFQSIKELASPGVIEQVGPDAYVGIGGQADAVVAGSRIDVPFSGFFEYCDGSKGGAEQDLFACSVAPTTCASTTHRLTLTRQ